MPRLLKVLDDLVCASRIGCAPAGHQENDIVKDVPNIGSRLVNGANNSPSTRSNSLQSENNRLG